MERDNTFVQKISQNIMASGSQVSDMGMVYFNLINKHRMKVNFMKE